MTDTEVTLSSTDWAALVERLEDLDDIAAVAKARAEDAGNPLIPIEVVEAKLAGHHPLAAWRLYRGLTQTALATKAAVGRANICQIELRRGQGGVKTMSRLARALDVPMECITESRA